MDGRGCRTPPPPILLRSDRASTLCGRCRPTYLSIPIANRSHIANPKTMATPATKATPIHCSTPAMISVIRTMQRCLLTPPSAYSLWNQTPKRALFLLCTLFSAGAQSRRPGGAAAAARARPWQPYSSGSGQGRSWQRARHSTPDRHCVRSRVGRLRVLHPIGPLAPREPMPCAASRLPGVRSLFTPPPSFWRHVHLGRRELG